jgi:hypothetical protein
MSRLLYFSTHTNLMYLTKLENFSLSQSYCYSGAELNCNDPTSLSVIRSNLWGSSSPFKQTFIIRGIGYRAAILQNTWLANNYPDRPNAHFFSSSSSDSSNVILRDSRTAD